MSNSNRVIPEIIKLAAMLPIALAAASGQPLAQLSFKATDVAKLFIEIFVVILIARLTDGLTVDAQVSKCHSIVARVIGNRVFLA